MSVPGIPIADVNANVKLIKSSDWQIACLRVCSLVSSHRNVIFPGWFVCGLLTTLYGGEGGIYPQSVLYMHHIYSQPEPVLLPIRWDVWQNVLLVIVCLMDQTILIEFNYNANPFRKFLLLFILFCILIGVMPLVRNFLAFFLLSLLVLVICNNFDARLASYVKYAVVMVCLFSADVLRLTPDPSSLTHSKRSEKNALEKRSKWLLFVRKEKISCFALEM